MKSNKIPSSFRDPNGFVFTSNRIIYRLINLSYKQNYDYFIKSGLYKNLVDKVYLIPHKEENTFPRGKNTYKIIKPEKIPFVSYSYEWCFSELKDAALLTLKVQKEALRFGMTLKDASSFNIQFVNGKPIFIDTLSFEKYEEGKPWIAYKQFCEQFLAPLTIAAYSDVRLNGLLKVFLDGIPLEVAANILPMSSKINPMIFLHIILHSRSYQTVTNIKKIKSGKQRSFSKNALMGLIDSLESGIEKLSCKKLKSIWTSYSDDNVIISYKDASFYTKKNLVESYLDNVKSSLVWDLGANTGIYSRITAKKGILTISLDYDPSVIEKSYLEVKQNNEKNLLPLVVDLGNPTPSIGWDNKERESIFQRPLPDTILALALIHHLAIGKNLPLSMLAEFFSKYCKNLIIEFVPKEDPQVRELLQNRDDIFPGYTENEFELEFKKFFEIKKKTQITDSKRTLYLLINKKHEEK